MVKINVPPNQLQMARVLNRIGIKCQTWSQDQSCQNYNKGQAQIQILQADKLDRYQNMSGVYNGRSRRPETH